MATFGKTFRTGAAAALLLAGLATGAKGQVPGGGFGSFGGVGRGMLQLKGKVVCTSCTLDEAQAAQPSAHQLYQFTHKRGQVVMQVSEVNDALRWSQLTGSPRIWVRAADKVFQQLSAEVNLFKEVEITGLLKNTRTLDIFAVTLHG